MCQLPDLIFDDESIVIPDLEPGTLTFITVPVGAVIKHVIKEKGTLQITYPAIEEGMTQTSVTETIVRIPSGITRVTIPDGKKPVEIGKLESGDRLYWLKEKKKK